MSVKRKWETQYENTDISKIEERLAELNEKYDNQKMTKEEQAEQRKLKTMKENLPIVKDLIEVRERRINEKSEIKKEIDRRESLEKLSKECDKLESELKQLEEKNAEIDEKLKNPDLSDKEKESLKSEKNEVLKKMDDNNNKFAENQTKLNNNPEGKYLDMSLDDLKNKQIMISEEISYCNFACNKLMQGYSWDAVEAAGNNFKFTANEQQSKKLNEIKDANREQNDREIADNPKEENNVENNEVAENEATENETTENEVAENETTTPAVVKVGLFAKFMDWAKNTKVGKWIVDTFSKNKETSEIEGELVDYENEEGDLNRDEDFESALDRMMSEPDKSVEDIEISDDNEEKEEIVEEPVQEIKEEKQSTHDNDFRKYLREVATKGLEKVDAEQTIPNNIDKKIELYEKRYNELLGRDDADQTIVEKLAAQIEELKAQRDIRANDDEGR